MKFSGIHTLTLLDYPGKVSAIVFTPGCNFRCHFCHNPEFVLPENLEKISSGFIPEEKIFRFLDTRKGKLDGLVISGGEPTVHPELPDFIRRVKAKGFLVKLDTNGTNPDMIRDLIEQNLIDYVAMDIKATPEIYEEIVAVKTSLQNIEETKKILMRSCIAYEFRTTVVKGIHTPFMIDRIAEGIMGAEKYTLQNYRNEKVLDDGWKDFSGFSRQELREMKRIAEKFVNRVEILE